MQVQKDVFKKAEGASASLKKITALVDQWTTTVSGMATICSELADEMVGFCSEDAYSTVLATKFKEAAQILSFQSSILVRGTDYSFTSPVMEHLGTYNAYMARRAKWFSKTEEETKIAKVIEDWYQGRHDSFRLPLAHLIGFQSFFFQNVHNIWNSLLALVDERQLIGFNESSQKDVLASMESLMANPLCLEQFRKFLDQDRATENLNFILDVNAFMALHSGNRTPFEEFSSHAKKIFSRYISSDGEQQVNLDYENVNQVSAKLACMVHAQERDELIFVDCRKSIIALLQSGPLPRFRASPLGQELALSWRPCRAPTEEVLRAASLAPHLSQSPSNSRKSFLSVLIPHSSSPPTTPHPTAPPPPSSLSHSDPTPPPAPSTPNPATPEPHSSNSPNPLSISGSPPSPHLQARKTRLPRSPSSPPVVAHAQMTAQQHAQQFSAQSFAAQASTPQTPTSSSPVQIPAEPSAQHRVRLEKGPNNESTPVFSLSRSPSISVPTPPKKTVSAGSLTGALPANMFVSPPRGSDETFSPKVIKIRRQGSVGNQLHTQLSFENLEKLFMSGESPDVERTIFVVDSAPSGNDDAHEPDCASDATHTSGRDADCESDPSSDPDVFDSGGDLMPRSRSAHEPGNPQGAAKSPSLRARMATTRANSEPQLDLGARGGRRWQELVRSCEALEYGSTGPASASSSSRASSSDSLLEVVAEEGTEGTEERAGEGENNGDLAVSGKGELVAAS